MTEEDLAVYAANDRIPGPNLDMAEWVLYYGLRDLYRAYKAGAVAKDHAARTKVQMILEFRENKKKLNEVTRMYQHQEKMWRRIEQTGAVYAKKRTIECADAFFEAVYGCKLKPRVEVEVEEL